MFSQSWLRITGPIISFALISKVRDIYQTRQKLMHLNTELEAKRSLIETLQKEQNSAKK